MTTNRASQRPDPLLLTSLTDFANKIGDQKPPFAGGQIIIWRYLVSYKLTTMTCRRLCAANLSFLPGKEGARGTLLALNSGNYRPDRVGPARCRVRHDAEVYV